MARYAIGDIQGCYKELMELLSKINFNPSIDILYLVGDLVNRGRESLPVLEWAYRHQDSIVTVLGNHDIFLLGRYAKTLKRDSNETIQDILVSPNAPKLIEWFRTCPLVYHDADYILVHAGIHPHFDFKELLQLAGTINQNLLDDDYGEFIRQIFGNKPSSWQDDLGLIDQLKFVINACTRMRYLDKNSYALDYKYKGELANKPETLVPWFKVRFNPSVTKKILFGHWAALGFYHGQQCIALDTGCVWGRKLTAINLENFEICQVDARID